jgi:hypothetical protein
MLSRRTSVDMDEVQAYTRSQITEGLILLDGKPFSFNNYEFYRAIYDGQWNALVMKCGRQVAKSTTGNNMIIANSISIPFFRTLFVSPSQAQTARFSHSRLQKGITHSPLVKANFTDPTIPMNVGMKHFTNGSEVVLSYASDDPDRVRGVSADQVIWDEIQDIIYDSVVPVVNECMAESEHGWTWYFGTPKSMENTIEYLWQQSSQDEWMMKCTGCNRYNYVVSDAHIGKRGILCIKCGKYLNPRLGQWYSMNPGAYVRGFHIPQLIMPQNNESEARWSKILYKYEHYSDSKFKNEVLGMSDAIGTRMVSLEELEELCRNYKLQRRPTKSMFKSVTKIVAGVDWSGGGTSEYASRTVIHVWGLLPDGRMKTLYYHIFPTANPVADVREIIQICRDYKVSLVCGDAGGGAVANSMLVEALGPNRVLQAQYGSIAQHIRWNGTDRYSVDRTAAIDAMMLDYKKGNVFFAHLEQMKAAIDDILSEYEEVTQRGKGKRIWSHFPSVPDDCLHAQVFGRIAMQIATGKVQFYPIEMSPTQAAA